MSDDDVVTHDDAEDSAWETAQEDLVVIGALTEALRATGTPTELARTDETSAAFIATRNAHAGAAPVAASVRTPAHAAAPRPFGRAAAVLAAAVASVLLVGGVASAATGSLPEPLQRFAHTVIGAPAPQPQAAADVTNTPSAAGPTPKPSPRSSSTAATSKPSATSTTSKPSPTALTSHAPSQGATAAPLSTTNDLCTSALAHTLTAAQRRSPEFAALRKAARAKGESVATYCGKASKTQPRPATKPKPSPTPTPTPTRTKATNKPKGTATTPKHSPTPSVSATTVRSRSKPTPPAPTPTPSAT